MLLYPRARSLHILYDGLNGERGSILCSTLHFQQLLFQVVADGALVAHVVQRGIVQPRDGSQGTGDAFFITGKMDETIATLAIDVLQSGDEEKRTSERPVYRWDCWESVSYLVNVRLLNGAVQHRSVLLKQLTK
jgi:hypothetical protein